MKWIKASERLPEPNTAKPLRIDGSDIGTGFLYAPPQNKYFNYRFWSSEYYEDVTYDRVEWLDESGIDENEKLKKENEGLKAGLLHENHLWNVLSVEHGKLQTQLQQGIERERELEEVLENNNQVLKSIVDDLPKGGLGVIFVKQQIVSNDKYLNKKQ